MIAAMECLGNLDHAALRNWKERFSFFTIRHARGGVWWKKVCCKKIAFWIFKRRFS